MILKRSKTWKFDVKF